MLDDFSTARISSPSATKPAPTGKDNDVAPSTSAEPPSAAPELPDDLADGEFAKQLQEGMAEMMQELQTNPEMAKQFEELMGAQLGGDAKDVLNAAPDSEPHADSSRTGGTPKSSLGEAPKANSDQQSTKAEPAGGNFQDSIRKTMDRMRESNESASAASAEAGQPNQDDFMAQMLKEIAQANGGADGNSEDAFSSMLLGMMEQLTNKDILYEPMKELDGKFPAWLAEREPGKPKADALSEADRIRYHEQYELVHEIVQRFERSEYSDQKPEDREFIVERMQKMQAAGAPPSDLVGDMGAASEMLVRQLCSVSSHFYVNSDRVIWTLSVLNNNTGIFARVT